MMLSVHEALGAMHAQVQTLGADNVALDDALGRVLAAPVRAVRDQPPFNVSAMDGYALRAADAPGRLRIAGESAAGRPFETALPLGCCVRISTGARMPEGANAVLIQEDARIEHGALIAAPAEPGRHVRTSGHDFTAGTELLNSGRRLTIGDIALAAAAGHAYLAVARAPRIAILPMGDELAQPGAEAEPAQIFDSASYAVAALVRAWGGVALRISAPVRDDPTLLAAAAAQALERCDMLVLIGGASVGPHDHARTALARLDFTILVEKIAIKPGKPTWFARGPRGLALGLPGNPASALVCARIFLAPLIEAFLAATPGRPCAVAVEAPIPANGPRESYLRARFRRDGARIVAAPIPDQDSSLVTALSASDGLLRRPAHASSAAEGQSLDALYWGPTA
jgi:molybdopterin molybdotransferase